MKKLICWLSVFLCLQPFSFAEVEFGKSAWKEGTKTANYDGLQGPDTGLKPETSVNIANAEIEHGVAGIDASGKVGGDQNFAKGDVKVGSANAAGSASVGANSANVNVNASMNLVEGSTEGQISAGGENLGAGIKGSGNVEVGAMAGMDAAAELSSEGLNLEAEGKVHFGPQAGGELAGTVSLIGINFEGKVEGNVAAGLGFSGKGIVNVSWTKLQLGGALGGVVGAGGTLGTSITIDISGLINNLNPAFDAQPWSISTMEQVRDSLDQQIAEMNRRNQERDFAQQMRDLFNPQGFSDFAKQRHLEDLMRLRDELNRQLGRASDGRVMGLTRLELGQGSQTFQMVLPDLNKSPESSTPKVDASADCDK